MIPLILMFACGDKETDTADVVETDTDTDTDTDADADVYAFENAAGDSTVSYSGQTARHALIAELKGWISDLTTNIDNGTYTPADKDAVLADINLYFLCDSGNCESLDVSVTDSLQTTIGEISTNKNLVGKLAGNDSATDHANWTSGDFAGWDGAASPQALVETWFDMLADNVMARIGGDTTLEEVFLTPEGHDLNQLIQKFLLGAVTFSQGADDYLDDDTDGKGLMADNTAAVEGKSYTALEHAWDEGYGYFGGAINYIDYTDDEIAGGDSIDIDGDGKVNVKTEKNWGHSINAAKRDRGAAAGAETDFTTDAWTGFYEGRKLIVASGGALSDADMTTLQGHRDAALLAWEKAIAATVVHYINDTLQDMNKFDSADYSFATHAKHWGEMKGFALGLQFNPHSPLSDANFVSFNDLVGTAPVLESASDSDISAYRADLISARDILGAAYNFDALNLGDDNGENGW